MKKLLFLFLFLASSNLYAQENFLFIGTYTNSGSKGIYVYTFNSESGKASWASNTEGVVNPSFLAVAPGKKHIYAVTETAKENAGSVSAFSFDNVSGKLTFINKQNSGGDNPCYVAVHKTGKWIVTGNYSGGNFSVLSITENGGLMPALKTIAHSGKSIDPKRQDRPHVHATVFSPDHKYLFVPDLGIDKIMIYKFDENSPAVLSEAKQQFAASIPGSGPRHFTFHPGKKFAYLVEEISGTVAVYKYKKGRLDSIQRISSHPADFKGAISSADIHLSPDGKFLYASNRGEANSIAIFSVDGKSGKLSLVGNQSTLGKTPRNFMIDPSGNYLLVANQATNNIVIFKRDSSTGLLTATGEEIKVPSPVCLQMIGK